MASHRRSTFSVIFILWCGLLILVMSRTEASNSRAERNSTETFHRATRDRRRYCGKVLTDTLALVCNSYPSPWRKKSAFTISDQSFEGSYREQLIEEIKQDLDELEQLAPEMFDDRPVQYRPFYPRFYQEQQHLQQQEQQQLNAIDPHRRVRRQIVDECCRKSCTLNTLKQYCAD
ncbi:LIRP [Ochlerotatus camptorhynchus]|uniref:LIRP n=1 Tax=Ochlerotatus camptorhynchus TaxID=644619 RepID=UPI0031DEFFBD